jgi:hypothetical protein
MTSSQVFKDQPKYCENAQQQILSSNCVEIVRDVREHTFGILHKKKLCFAS